MKIQFEISIENYLHAFKYITYWWPHAKMTYIVFTNTKKKTKRIKSMNLKNKYQLMVQCTFVCS